MKYRCIDTRGIKSVNNPTISAVQKPCGLSFNCSKASAWRKRAYEHMGIFLHMNLPISQRSHGLPQAAPSVAQHSDFSVAPFIFTSQRPSWMFSQQVPFMLSAWSKYMNVHQKKRDNDKWTSWHLERLPWGVIAFL